MIKGNKQKIIVSSLIVIILIGGLILLFSNKNKASEPKLEETKINIFEQNKPEDSGMSIATSSGQAASSTTTKIKKNIMPIVKIQTNKGEITLELFSEDAPKTVENFINLVKKGFYDNVIFHRVISGFMIQGGDPTGTGRGGPGYKFDDELNPETASYQRGYVRGTLAMANSGPNTNGSQFFIMHKDYPLPNNYTIFGRVTDGMETVDAIAASETDSNDRPLEDVVMQKVEVIE